MFKFNFDIEDGDDEFANSLGTTNEKVDTASEVKQYSFEEISVSHLLDCLPSQISCSPLTIPLTTKPGGSITLARRDLFDARFQLISDETGGPDEQDNNAKGSSGVPSALEFLEAPSDLVPGVYEGGLKTWECSLDLVDYLYDLKEKAEIDIHGKRVLELGCGTAVPSLFLLQELFSSLPKEEETTLHLQDYNSSTFELVTFPNVILAWYMSPASASFRESATSDIETPLPPADSTFSAELPITPKLKSAFEASLRFYRVSLRFFSGSWGSFDLGSTGSKYDLVLTSETIYRKDSLLSLIDLMYDASLSANIKALEDATSQLSLSSSAPCLCLVAAKVFYFGVGGGVTEFTQAVESRQKEGGKGNVTTVWERNIGVGRKIMRISWT